MYLRVVEALMPRVLGVLLVLFQSYLAIEIRVSNDRVDYLRNLIVEVSLIKTDLS